jgi:hypothetical protein
MSSKPLMLPARHLINGSLLGVNLAAMGGFLAAGYLGLKTLLSFIKGYMRVCTSCRHHCIEHVLWIRTCC